MDMGIAEIVKGMVAKELKQANDYAKLYIKLAECACFSEDNDEILEDLNRLKEKVYHASKKHTENALEIAKFSVESV